MTRTMIIALTLAKLTTTAMAQYDINAANREWRMQMLEDQADRMNQQMKQLEWSRPVEPTFPEHQMYQPKPYLDFLPADEWTTGPRR